MDMSNITRTTLILTLIFPVPGKNQAKEGSRRKMFGRIGESGDRDYLPLGGRGVSPQVLSLVIVRREIVYWAVFVEAGQKSARGGGEWVGTARRPRQAG